jgi:hypothetical protein
MPILKILPDFFPLWKCFCPILPGFFFLYMPYFGLFLPAFGEENLGTLLEITMMSEEKRER